MYMDLSKISGGWVVQNLRQYGNTVLPPELIKEFGIEKIEGVLSTIIGCPVWIEKKHYPKEITPNGISVGRHGYFYIARTSKDPIVTKKTVMAKTEKWRMARTHATQ